MVSRETIELSLANSKPELDEDGLVIPKKLHNPSLVSKDHQDLRREIKWNEKAGICLLLF